MNDKPTGNKLMIALRLGERQRFTNKTRDTLTKRKIPTFLVSCLTGFLAHSMMGAFWQDRLISLPEVGVGATAAISGRDGLPQPAAGGSTDRRRPTTHPIPEYRPLAWAVNSPPGSATARPDQPAISAHFVGPHRRCVPARANWPVLDTLATLADGVLAVLPISAPILDTLHSPCSDIARCPLYSDHS